MTTREIIAHIEKISGDRIALRNGLMTVIRLAKRDPSLMDERARKSLEEVLASTDDN